MFDLTGKKALITGASGGIGGAIARMLAAQGAAVALSGRNEKALASLADEIGASACVLPCELAEREEAKALAGRAQETMGGLDILVNNAGITRDQLLLRMKDEDWDSVLALGLTAAFLLSRAGLRYMLRQKYGRIITITSLVGSAGNPGQVNYAAAKAGAGGMTRALAREVAQKGVTVNCVAPGFIETPMTAALTESQREAAATQIPANRFGRPEEIAHAVLFLASAEAGYITGQTLHVNGGMLMI